ncbi:MAG TPA: GMC family oxidoreductase [Longimicrobiales bacterium]|nr:GMC family oxidoreductase [Longimicrobiales bacterium]
MSTVEYDLLLVGTGFATTFFLRSYLDHAPPRARVLVLERGFLFPHAERLKVRRGEPSAYARINEASEATFINATPGKPWFFQTGFGGSSNCWFGCTPRFMPSDFRLRSRYGVAADWPIGYDDLAPYYDRAEEIMAVAGPEDTPFPRSGPYPQPPHLFTPVDDILQQRHGNLYISQPTARARLAVNGRLPCCANAVCGVCPVNAKFTIENSGMGVYEDPRVELRSGAQVFALELEGSTVKAAYFRSRGREETVSAEVYALGANAMFNAHILLSSGDTNPFTGRGLGEQVGVQATILLAGLANVGGSTWVNANGYMLYDGDHRATSAACLIEANNAAYIRNERGKWRDIARFRMIFEDLPSDDNAVTRSSDPLRPEVCYQQEHSAYVQAGVARMKERLPALLADLPVEDIRYDKEFASEAHILGTTRMSDTAATGVVDRHLIHHRYRNLFVLGGGAFPTFSPANPTLTLSALSMFAADRSFGSRSRS